MSETQEHPGINLMVINIHGLLRASGLEIGKDADNGGQTKYVYEWALGLSQHESIKRVDIFTRRIDDPKLSPDYNQPIEIINDKFFIHRISFGGKKYRMKEQLWAHLDEFVAGAINHIRAHNLFPHWIHSHYGDAGYAATEISRMLKIPFSHTGHSLGMHKRKKVEAMGMTPSDAENRFKFETRISAEEQALLMSNFIVTSTQQEIESYNIYNHASKAIYHVLPPGIDLEKFAPYYQQQMMHEDGEEEELQRKYWVGEYIEKFLTQPHKPVILALSRPDRRKNLHTLLEVYGNDKSLQSLANLVIFAGIRKDIEQMPEADREVLVDILLLMDKYDLYGKLAIPKKHDVDNEVATIYRYCAEKRGVFVNLTLYENFGLTIIESASAGLPVIATRNGGPSEILPKCKNGILVDPENPSEITKAIFDVLTDDRKWKEFSNQGILNVKNYYSWQTHIDAYIDLVKKELSKPQEQKEVSNQTRVRNMDRLFASDIDGTLILQEHSNPGLAEINEVLSNRPANMAFALSSGRSTQLVLDAIEQFDFADPDFLITSVGSEIYYRSNKRYHKDKAWSKHLDWRWDRGKIAQRLKATPWLSLQEEEGQNPHKISYYLDPEHYDERQLKLLLGKQWANVTLIRSHERFLDVLPKRANKGKALAYICRKWAIPMSRVITAGDSGNDLEMLVGPAFGIAVGNRASELEHLKPGKTLFLANQPAALGILEGLKHYGWI